MPAGAGGGREVYYYLSRGQVAPSTTGVDKIDRPVRDVHVDLSSAQNRRRRCCRKRAIGRKPNKERTNERTSEGGDPHACEKTRPDAVVVAPSSRRRRSEVELRIPSCCRRRGVFGLSVPLSVRLSVCRLHYPPPHFAYFHYRPTTYGLLPLWVFGGGEGT